MILFIDTETTGLWHWKELPSHPDQPHLVQLAALLCEQDGSRVREMNQIIYPDGWTIPQSASHIHRITTERAIAFGEPLTKVLNKFKELLPGVKLLIAHNIKFDTNVLFKSFLDSGISEPLLASLEWFCSMKRLTDRMNLPSRKWPTLEEAWLYMFPDGLPLDNRHSAMGDVLACRDIYLAGRDRGWW